MFKLLLCIIAIFIYSNAYAGSISVEGCSKSTGRAVVVLLNASGNWIGFSAKTSSGEIIDVSPQKFAKFEVKSGARQFKFGSNNDVVEVRSSTWMNFNKKTNLMEQRMDDTGWVECK